MINSPFVSPDITFCKSLHPCVNVMWLPFLLLVSVFRIIMKKNEPTG